MHLVELFAAVLASRLSSRLSGGIMSSGDELHERREQADPILQSYYYYYYYYYCPCSD